jgi:hypothetical protein
MMIRPAKAVDIPAIMDLLKEGYRSCRFAGEGAPDEQYAKQFLHRCVMRHGGHGESGVGHFVAEHDGRVIGHIIGHKNRIGEIGNKFFVSDSLFYVSPGASATAALGLVNAVETWAATDPRVLTIVFGCSDMIANPERTAALFERLGYRRMGFILEKRVGRAQEAA